MPMLRKIAINKILGLIVAFGVFTLVVSCRGIDIPIRTEKISHILSSPSKYSGKVVTVSGKVTEAITVFGIGYFILADETGSITVIPSKTFPKVGEKVKIRGTVENAIVIGDNSVTVIVEGKT